MDPLVTVCVLVHNGEAFLKDALDSLLAQTYTNFELIILDNHSTDGTQEIYKKYNDTRLRVIRHKKNIGPFENLNQAIIAGKGDYLAIFHDDDTYEPTILAEHVSILEAHPDVMCVYSQAYALDASGARTGEQNSPPELLDRELSYGEVLKHIVKTQQSPFITPSLLARRAAFRTTGKFEKKYGMALDVDMHLKLTKAGKTWISSERLMNYRHSDGQYSINYSTTYEEPNVLFSILDDHLFAAGMSPSRSYEAHRDWDYSICAINILAKDDVSSEDKKKARQYLRKSLTFRRLLDPFLPITVAMCVLAHLGLGTWLATKINKRRWERHLQ
ncbi:MAG: glycosyltransferase [Candidatus Woesearchaeota archaeon]|nr:glycosyltransferase [Candidatus Woesearchaeota archaeon]